MATYNLNGVPNRYAITNGYPSEVENMTRKPDKRDQVFGLKYMTVSVLGFVSYFTHAKIQDKKKLDALCDQVLNDTHPCTNISNLVAAGLEESDYVRNIHRLANLLKQCKSQSDYDALVNNPLFQAVSYITNNQRWEGWESARSNTIPLNYALSCFLDDKSNYKYPNLFLMLKDSLNGTGNIKDSIREIDGFITYLKRLPAFRREYFTPEDGDVGSERF